LLYRIGRAGKTKEVAKAQVEPVVGLFEGKPIPPLYACVQVEQILNSIYEYNEIDIPLQMGRIALDNVLAAQFFGISEISYYLIKYHWLRGHRRLHHLETITTCPAITTGSTISRPITTCPAITTSSTIQRGITCPAITTGTTIQRGITTCPAITTGYIPRGISTCPAITSPDKGSNSSTETTAAA